MITTKPIEPKPWFLIDMDGWNIKTNQHVILLDLGKLKANEIVKAHNSESNEARLEINRLNTLLADQENKIAELGLVIENKIWDKIPELHRPMITEQRNKIKELEQENKKLSSMIDNGLTWDDLKDDTR